MTEPKNVISGARAVAEAVRLCKPDVIPMYPITPQFIQFKIE